MGSLRSPRAPSRKVYPSFWTNCEGGRLEPLSTFLDKLRMERTRSGFPSIKVEASTCGQSRDFEAISWAYGGARRLIVLAYRARSPIFWIKVDGVGWGRLGARREAQAPTGPRARPREAGHLGADFSQEDQRAKASTAQVGSRDRGRGAWTMGQRGRPASLTRGKKGGRRAIGAGYRRGARSGASITGRPQARRANSTEQISGEHLTP